MLAREIPCPAVCRDEIKERLVHSQGEYTPAPGDDMARRTLDVFFGVIGFLIDAGLSLVAESAFQHRLWEPGLRPLLDSARVCVVQCRVDTAVAWERISKRAEVTPARLAVHGDYSLSRPFESFKEGFENFDPVTLPVQSLEVNTTDRPKPSVEEIVKFLNRP